MFDQRRKIIIGVIIGLLVALSLSGSLSNQFDFQGRLTDNNGNPITGTRNITFQVCDIDTMGTVLWTETHSVEVNNGLFKVVLGAVNPIPDDLAYSTQMSALQFEVENDGVMTPYIPINPVPYAFTDYDWVQLAEDMYAANSGNVGIGTDAPSVKLDIYAGYYNALRASSQITGPEASFIANNSGNGCAGNFTNNSTIFPTVNINQNGVGTALEVSNTGQSFSPAANFENGGNGPAIRGFNDGSGTGGSFFAGSSSTGFGLYACSFGTGSAGIFDGNVHVNGTLSKNGGSFKIDHPFDPANKYLSHSFVESPDMMNVYNGNIILDSEGKAIVELPYYFEEINMDFRYQLTCIGDFSQVYIAEEIRKNRFKIAGGKPGIKVSWQVTGIRNDPFAKANRIKVETEKTGHEKGKYLNPELYGQSQKKSMYYDMKKQELKTIGKK